jgi:hypothetical protein
MEDKSKLSDESIANLRRILGRSIHTIFAPNLDAAGPHLASWALSMMKGVGSFITFECERRETPYFMLDSWIIHVAESSQPLRIERNESDGLISCSTISIYNATPVEAIDVYRFTDSHEDKGVSEAVEYDGAIIFRCEQGKQFAIGCSLNGPGIAEFVHFSEDTGVIADLIGSGKLRLTLPSL